MRFAKERLSCRYPLRLLSIWLAVSFFSVIQPNPASAQFEGFVEKVTDIQFSTSCWSTTADFDSTSCFENYGVEVLWNLGRFPIRSSTPTGPQKLVRIEVVSGDTLLVYEPVAPAPPARGPILLELGLGWAQINEFSEVHTNYELHGSVRELPSVALYATHTGYPGQPYIGIRSGVIRLQNAQMVAAAKSDTSTLVKGYFGSGEAFQLGGVIGGALTLDPNLHLIVEGGYHRRFFPSVSWAAAPADLPVDFPRALNFSGPSLSVGLQVKLRDPK